MPNDLFRLREADQFMQKVLTDLRFSWRLLWRTPGFAGVVIATLAVGIGLTTTMFSVVNGLLLSPLPYPDADRLVMLWQGRAGMEVEEDWFSIAQYVDVRDGTSAFDETALAVGFGATVTGRGAPTEIGYVRASSAYLRLLGATAIEGRLLTESDDAGDAARVALISFGVWQSLYGADPDVVGQTITLDGQSTPIVGVLARDVLLDNEVLPTLGAVDPLGVVLSLPLSDEMLRQRNREDYNIMARLAEDATLQQAQAQLDAVAARIQEQHESDPGSGFFIRALSLLDEVVGDVRRALVVLLASVSILLLIACGNVANLMLSRATERQRELGIRAAIGAGRGQLIRQLMTESALISALGGVCGIGLSIVGVAGLRALGQESLPRIQAVQIDPRVLAFAMVVTIVTTFIFGLVPAMRATRLDLVDVMKQSAGGVVGHRNALWSSFNLSSLLVIAEIGLSLILLVGAGLLGRSLVKIADVDPGFRSDNRITFQVRMRGPMYPRARRMTLARQLEQALSELPRVEQVGAVSLIPFGGNLAWTPITVPGYVPPDGGSGEFIASLRMATNTYFDALAIPLLQGRTFAEQYDDGDPGEVIIDARVANRFFEGRNPIGQPIQVFGTQPQTVVGVVGSIKHTGLDDPSRYMLYLANEQMGSSNLALVVQTDMALSVIAPLLTTAVEGVDPDLAIVDLATMNDRVQGSLAQRRFSMLLLRIFSVFALVLATIGVYGLLAYRVTLGTRELGMRMALGAPRLAVLQMVLVHGMTLTVVGMVVGVAGALSLTRALGTMLFETSPTDPMTYAAMIVGIGVVAALACTIPSLRATRVDPLQALRSD